MTRKRIWEIVEVAKKGDKISRIFDIFILSLIFLNVLAVIFGSISSFQKNWETYLEYFEVISVLIFSLEYIARIWSCTADPIFKGSLKGRVKFAAQIMPLIDLLAILPFYLPFLGVDLRSIRILRLLRLFRLAKIGRYYSSLDLINNVFKSRKEELVLTTVLLIFLLVISSSLLYYCENDVQPENFSSIPASMWWSIATLTTVGYGDIYPLTTLGKLLSGIISVLGIGMFALPTGILGAGFVEEIQKRKTSEIHCPYCGNKLK